MRFLFFIRPIIVKPSRPCLVHGAQDWTPGRPWHTAWTDLSAAGGGAGFGPGQHQHRRKLFIQAISRKIGSRRRRETRQTRKGGAGGGGDIKHKEVRPGRDEN